MEHCRLRCITPVRTLPPTPTWPSACASDHRTEEYPLHAFSEDTETAFSSNHPHNDLECVLRADLSRRPTASMPPPKPCSLLTHTHVPEYPPLHPRARIAPLDHADFAACSVVPSPYARCNTLQKQGLVPFSLLRRARRWRHPR